MKSWKTQQTQITFLYGQKRRARGALSFSARLGVGSAGSRVAGPETLLHSFQVQSQEQRGLLDLGRVTPCGMCAQARQRPSFSKGFQLLGLLQSGGKFLQTPRLLLYLPAYLFSPGLRVRTGTRGPWDFPGTSTDRPPSRDLRHRHLYHRMSPTQSNYV